MARGIFDTIAPEEYLELAEANVRFINTKIKETVQQRQDERSYLQWQVYL